MLQGDRLHLVHALLLLALTASLAPAGSDCDQNGVSDDVDVTVQFETLAFGDCCPTKVLLGDVEQDGDTDILAGSSLWINNGQAEFESHTVGLQFSSNELVKFSDIDLDGDADFLKCHSVWVDWRNNQGPEPDGSFDFSSGGGGELYEFNATQDIPIWEKSAIADFDADGDDDIFVYTECNWGCFCGACIPGDPLATSTLNWLENRYVEGEDMISHLIDHGLLEDSAVADMDGDGRTDLIVSLTMSTTGGNELGWYRRTDDGFAPRTTIAAEPNYSAGELFVLDIDGDGLSEVVSGGLWKNIGGVWQLVEGSILSTVMPDLAIDADADGDIDLFDWWNANGGNTLFYENLDGTGDFAPGVAVITHNAARYSADFDGNGRPDLMGTPNNSSTISLNTHADCNHNEIPDSCEVPDPSVACADADQDGIAFPDDCDDHNLLCGLDCTDLDSDGVCASFDCNDTNGACRLHCVDPDGDGYCSDQDCDEGNAACGSDCSDGDGDGLRDCEDPCPLDPDADGDGYGAFGTCPEGPADCDDSKPGCALNCSDQDGDGWCSDQDCNDLRRGCAADCVDDDGDGRSECFDDCDDANPNCTLSCNDNDGDGTCDSDCNDEDPFTGKGFVERNDGSDNNCPGDPGFGLTDELTASAGYHNPFDKSLFVWTPQIDASIYEVYRSDSPTFDEACVHFVIPQNWVLDGGTPDSGKVYYYLARSLTPNAGSWSTDRSDPERNPCSGN